MMPQIESISNAKTIAKTVMKKKKTAGKKLFVVKVRCLPFGFFEEQLLGYFSQFGTVLRVRVSRSLKTGNFKGWGYVGFDNKDVAEIAAETMNGYLMFEKRLICTVMTENPKCMLSGPRIRAPPHMKGAAKKDTNERNKPQTAENESKAKARVVKQLAKQEQELKNMGIDYDFSVVPSYTKASSAASALDIKKKEEKPIDEVTEVEVEEVPAKTPRKSGRNFIADIVVKQTAVPVTPAAEKKSAKEAVKKTSVKATETPARTMVTRSAKKLLGSPKKTTPKRK